MQDLLKLILNFGDQIIFFFKIYIYMYIFFSIEAFYFTCWGLYNLLITCFGNIAWNDLYHSYIKADISV